MRSGWCAVVQLSAGRDLIAALFVMIAASFDIGMPLVMAKTILLPLLANGEFRSGQDLATALGVSRTAVWKQLNNLAELGLEIESVKGRGYRIPGGLDLLDAAAVQAGLQPQAAGLLAQLELLEATDSTNAEVMRQLTGGAGSGLVCSAEQQSAGRGRRGRQWVSPYGRNLYVSVAWEYQQGAAALEGLSLAVGVGVARALAACGLPPVQLKWPNDILYGGAKLGGILLEMTGDAAGACQVVVGVGLNVAMPAVAAHAIEQDWTDVQHSPARKSPRPEPAAGGTVERSVTAVSGVRRWGLQGLEAAVERAGRLC